MCGKGLLTQVCLSRRPHGSERLHKLKVRCGPYSLLPKSFIEIDLVAAEKM
jgi:hypothetical protein